jgi:hypothetical protein
MSCLIVAVPFAALHAHGGETPDWKQRFGVDTCLRAIE